MPTHTPGAASALPIYQLPAVVKAQQARHQQLAKQLLADYLAGVPAAVAEFEQRHSEATKPGFSPTLLDARMLVTSRSTKVRRLSLERLKNDAKDLLKQLKQAQPDALKRLTQHHPKTISEPKLADAQLVIAREQGLASWPKLKAHVEKMNAATEQMERPTAPPDRGLKTLHVRCGNDIKSALTQCGFEGTFLEVSNPFPQGRVPHFEPMDAFIKTRSDFIQTSYSGDIPAHFIENSPAEIRHAEETLRQLPSHYQRAVMWYEHDPFDQLSKAYVYAHLAALELDGVVIESVQIDHFPGVPRFIGIGQLSQTPEAILALWPERTPITSAELAFGARCWQAFTSDNPTTLWQLTQEAHSPLPTMQHAMERALMELPWSGNGLSLTEHLALQILAQEAPMCPGEIFNLLLTELEPLHFLGDIMLVSVLRPLWQGTHPAIEVLEEHPDKHPMERYILSLTDLGNELLLCKQNWLNVNSASRHGRRFVGGVEITPGKQNWCWSAQHQRPELI